LYRWRLAVAKDGSMYMSNLGIIQGSGDPNVPSGLSGQVIRVSDTVSAG
jgi:hypothetical protein